MSVQLIERVFVNEGKIRSKREGALLYSRKCI